MIMSKKNPATNYTPDTHWLERLVKNNLVTIVVQIAAVVAVLANLYVASRISPLSQDQAILTTRVNALELRSVESVPRPEIEGKFETLVKNDERIESKLDQLLLRK